MDSNVYEVPRSSLEPNSTRATVGGVGGGTGVVAIAQSLGVNTTPGTVLLYIAPLSGYIVGALLLYLEVQVSRYLSQRVINKAEKTMVGHLDNPRTSDEHKAKILAMLEQLEESVATAELARVKLIGLPIPSTGQQRPNN